MNQEWIYLAAHGIVTVGAVIGFAIRLENRITTLEVSHKLLKRQHDAITNYGTKPHGGSERVHEDF